MSGPLLLGIDEGTTAVKAALFDTRLRKVAQARRAVAVEHPRPGWVEQDPEEILAAVVAAVAEVLEHTPRREVIAAGLDHQGESVLAWERGSARALTPVVVWQDKRQLDMLANVDQSVARLSGMPIDPYFSAGKIAWLLAHDDAVARGREERTLRVGTVDAFLCERLGGRFATDLSTASRTQLLALGGVDWDERLLDAFGVQRSLLPRIGPSFGELGELRHERWRQPLPLRAQLVDQQAALAGSGAVRPGAVKATYGTGVFVLARTPSPAAEPGGLLPTVAWGAPPNAALPSTARERASREEGAIGEVAHALDGGVFSAGSLLDWLAGGLGLAASAAELAARAAEVSDSAGVELLPALDGVGAPWWLADARGVIAGLHAGVRPAHIARAALEGIAARVADVVEAVADTVPVERVLVDGGLTNDPTLLQIQADMLGLALSVGDADCTVLGAAMLAGVGAGIYESVEQAAELLPERRVVQPQASAAARERKRARWRAFVRDAARLSGASAV